MDKGWQFAQINTINTTIMKLPKGIRQKLTSYSTIKRLPLKNIKQKIALPKVDLLKIQRL